MPAKSKAQQALFGMALAVRRGELERTKVTKEVLNIVDSDMTDKEIEDFAATKHKGLKDHVEESLFNTLNKVFIVIKPDFLNIYSDVLQRFEKEGFILRDCKLKKLTIEEAQSLYLPHKDQPFYDDLCNYMSSDYSLGLLFSTYKIDPFEKVKSLKDDIRKLYSVDEMKNAIHGSDSTDNVLRESSIYFN